MDLPKFARRSGIVFYLQVAAAVVSIFLGLAQMTKESQPFVQKIQENQKQVAIKKQQENAQKRAVEISQMQIAWQYRGNDGAWRYYSDNTGRFWTRVNIQGIYEYCENPQLQIANNTTIVR
jgi:hypothetical protein